MNNCWKANKYIGTVFEWIDNFLAVPRAHAGKNIAISEPLW